LQRQAFAPNQVKPYICTTEARPLLFVKTEIQQRASSEKKETSEKSDKELHKTATSET